MQNKCAAIAENAVQNEGRAQQAELVDINSENNFVYNIRVNYDGGGSAHEVILTSKCKLVTKRIPWSE